MRERIAGMMRGAKRMWARGGFYFLSALCAALAGLGLVAARGRVERPPAPAATSAPRAVLDSADEALAEKAMSPLSWPVSGRRILRGNTLEELTWWESLGAYRQHAGIDIEAVRGEAVTAALDGKVTAAYEDPLMGYTVEITAPDGTWVRCANLSTLTLAKVGGTVRAGDVIGAVGDSAAAEAGLADHLHFEAWKDGEWIELPTA